MGFFKFIFELPFWYGIILNLKVVSRSIIYQYMLQTVKWLFCVNWLKEVFFWYADFNFNMLIKNFNTVTAFFSIHFMYNYPSLFFIKVFGDIPEVPKSSLDVTSKKNTCLCSDLVWKYNLHKTLEHKVCTNWFIIKQATRRSFLFDKSLTDS